MPPREVPLRAALRRTPQADHIASPIDGAFRCSSGVSLAPRVAATTLIPGSDVGLRDHHTNSASQMLKTAGCQLWKAPSMGLVVSGVTGMEALQLAVLSTWLV